MTATLPQSTSWNTYKSIRDLLSKKVDVIKTYLSLTHNKLHNEVKKTSLSEWQPFGLTTDN